MSAQKGLPALLSAALLILSMASVSFAQRKVDVVHLKNGDILKGDIVENIPNNRIRIEIDGRFVVTVKYSEVQKIGKETAEPSSGALLCYEAKKKSPSGAAILSLLVSSTGHAYAGNWGRGLLFTLGRLISVVGIAQRATTPGRDGELASNLGTAGLVIMSIAEPIDAAGIAKEHNRKLYKQLSGQTYSFGIAPYRDGVQVAAVRRF